MTSSAFSTALFPEGVDKVERGMALSECTLEEAYVSRMATMAVVAWFVPESISALTHTFPVP